MRIRALLLDLDGTLVDTAPDMVAALNRLLEECGRPAVTPSAARHVVSDGALGLLRFGFGDTLPDSAAQARLRERFLALYSERLSDCSRPFPGYDEVFALLGRRSWPWGVVTNKPEALARRLLDDLGLSPACACLIGGDTLPQRKPDPAPLLAAARAMTVDAGECVYVGDSERDMQAARAAGMRAVAAGFGYLRDPGVARCWNADAVVSSPLQLASWMASQTG